MEAAIRPFSEIGRNDAGIAGGKGASLGEMTQAGIPVPPGFVILAPAFDRFLAETDLNVEIDAILGTVNNEEMHTVEHASEKIQALILAAKMPEDIGADVLRHFKELGAEFVAVRSSATAEDGASAAWAGQLDTFLNTTEAELLKNVQRCWASLFTPRAIFYRFEKGFDSEKVSVAVVVQKMVDSDASGIAFSVHPVTEDRNQLIIEASFGLGEAIVSGQITPDSYVVTKSPREIIDKNVATKSRGLFRKEGGGNEWKEIEAGKRDEQTLSDAQILEFSDLIVRIENHYGFPCDIEWAMEGSAMYITQSRPITTLSEAVSAAPVTLSKIFTRERPLFYLQVWDVCDKEALQKYLGETLRGVFIVPKRGQTGSVWYPASEYERFQDAAEARINASKEFCEELVRHEAEGWRPLVPYLVEGKRIESAKEFYDYYRAVVNYWYPMNSPFFAVQDRETLDPEFRSAIIKAREEHQEYTNNMVETYLEYFERTFPEHAHLSFYVTPEEVIKFEKGPSPELLQELEARAVNGCFMLDGKVYPLDRLTSVLGDNGLALEEAKTSDGPIKGQVGYKGFARGKVRLILSKADMAKMQQGEILVAPVTEPMHVPAMKLAAAFVTDEGGITCHTAIVAREMQTPAVIGTKIATQVLKDGDMVEVDANNGVVRKV